MRNIGCQSNQNSYPTDFYHEDLAMEIFSGHSESYADSRSAIDSKWRNKSALCTGNLRPLDCMERAITRHK